MNRLFVGLDTSNYRTSIAAVGPEGEILMNLRELLPVKQAMMWMLRTLVKKGITTARNVLPTD